MDEAKIDELREMVANSMGDTKYIVTVKFESGAAFSARSMKRDGDDVDAREFFKLMQERFPDAYEFHLDALTLNADTLQIEKRALAEVVQDPSEVVVIDMTGGKH